MRRKRPGNPRESRDDTAPGGCLTRPNRTCRVPGSFCSLRDPSRPPGPCGPRSPFGPFCRRLLSLAAFALLTSCHTATAPCPVDFGATKELPPRLRENVIAPSKTAWENALGGPCALLPYLHARLSGWPRFLVAPRDGLPREDEAFLRRVAADTWRGIAALVDRENGLPVDHIRLGNGSIDLAGARIGDYTSGTNVGLYLAAVAAATRLGAIPRAEAVTRLTKALDTLERLESYRGFLYNFYDTTSLERTSNFISFVDTSWLAAGLVVARNAFPELAARCTRWLDRLDLGFFYDSERGLVSHGYYVHAQERSPFDYGALYTEARLGVLLGVGKGEIPEAAWFEMTRTFPAGCGGQSLAPRGVRTRTVRGHRISAGYYEWKGSRFVPSWGGSAFEALMPSLLLDEQRFAPASLGANNRAHAEVQRRYATEVLGYPVWGLSPSATPDDDDEYREYGVKVLGARGYVAGAVTPHASALALSVTPAAAIENLRRLAERYAVYGDFGFYDALDPVSGRVAHRYLTLDQTMLFLAVANHLCDGCVRNDFAADPIVQAVLPVIGEERFFE